MIEEVEPSSSSSSTSKTTAATTIPVVVVSRYHPDEIIVDETTQKPLLNVIDEYNDHFYKFNHTRCRCALI
jgi:hypothetical protein